MAPTESPDLEDLKTLRLALEPTRWVLLRRAARLPIFRAEEALGIARAEADFAGSEQTARFHASWLAKRGYLETIEDQGRVAYRITTPGRQLYDHVVAVIHGDAESVRPRTESRLLAIVASLAPDAYDVFSDDTGELDIAADLRSRLESVLVARARLRVEHPSP